MTHIDPFPVADHRAVLSPAEVVLVAGGYKRPAEQLRELHRLGFWRARRAKVTGEVVLERPHFEAVSSGAAAGAAASQPKLRPALRRP